MGGGVESDGGARPRAVQFDIVLTEGFVLTEFAAVTDALRITNRVGAMPVFEWTCRSPGGGAVASPSGAVVQTEPLSAAARPDYAFVIGNRDPMAPELSMGLPIRRYIRGGAKVFLLAEAASRYLKEKGGEAQGLATHWENSVVLRERMELFGAGTQLASEDGAVVTCAGMGTTLDVVLSVIREHVPSATLTTVASIFLHERIRDFSTRQPTGGTTGVSTGDADLDRAVQIMQAHIEEPVSIADLVEELGVSARTLERKFRTHFDATPKTYYRRLRLAQANNLLLNTSMSIQEIGLATGFASGFSALYKEFFGLTPRKMREQRRGAARKRETG